MKLALRPLASSHSSIFLFLDEWLDAWNPQVNVPSTSTASNPIHRSHTSLMYFGPLGQVLRALAPRGNVVIALKTDVLTLEINPNAVPSNRGQSLQMGGWGSRVNTIWYFSYHVRGYYRSTSLLVSPHTFNCGRSTKTRATESFPPLGS